MLMIKEIKNTKSIVGGHHAQVVERRIRLSTVGSRDHSDQLDNGEHAKPMCIRSMPKKKSVRVLTPTVTSIGAKPDLMFQLRKCKTKATVVPDDLIYYHPSHSHIGYNLYKCPPKLVNSGFCTRHMEMAEEFITKNHSSSLSGLIAYGECNYSCISSSDEQRNLITSV